MVAADGGGGGSVKGERGRRRREGTGTAGTSSRHPHSRAPTIIRATKRPATEEVPRSEKRRIRRVRPREPDRDGRVSLCAPVRRVSDAER